MLSIKNNLQVEAKQIVDAQRSQIAALQAQVASIDAMARESIYAEPVK